MKTNRIKRCLSAILAIAMLLTMLPSMAFAETESNLIETTSSAGDSRLALVIEKLTLGQGYHTEPVWVNFEPGQRLSEILADFLGDGNFEYTGSIESSFYLASLKDQGDTTTLAPPSYLDGLVELPGDGVSKEGWLGQFDYTSQSGWLYMVNNQLAQVGMSDTYPNNGDVVRLTFTIYGLGADVSVPTWGDEPVHTGFAQFDNAIKVMADFNAREDREEQMAIPRVSNAYNALVAATTNLMSVQNDVRTALLAFQAALVPVDLTGLEDAIEKAESLEESAYTSISWDNMQAALEAAKTVLEDENATSTTVSSACSALEDAIANLEPLSQTPVTITNPQIKQALAGLLGKGENYEGDLTEGEINEIDVPVDLSNTDATDDDIKTICPLLKSTPSIDLSNNPRLTADAADYENFDWGIPKSLNFSGCTGITEIKEAAFVDDTWTFYSKLNGITFPETLTKIGSYAFCSAPLTEITIPNVEMGEGVFSDCTLLEKITFAEGVTQIPDQAYMDQGNIKEVVFPSTLETIGTYSFMGCGLTSVTLPKGLTKIGESAFTNNQLVDVTINSVSATWGNNVFSDNQQLETVTFDDGMTEVPNSMFARCPKLSTLKLPGSITKIGDSSFDGAGLTELVIPESITTIGSNAFANSKIAKLTIPASVKTIEEGAFYNTQITEVTIPATVEKLGFGQYWGVFSNCSKLETVNIESLAVNTANALLRGCESLTSLTLPQGMTAFPKEFVLGCKNLTSIDIQPTVTSIGDMAFSGTGISQMDLSNVTTVGQGLFAGCNNIKNVSDITFHPSITSLTGTFNGCNGLTEIKLPEQIKTISANTFVNCKNVTKVDFSTLDVEGFSATLEGCEGITSTSDVVFPAGLTTLPNKFFFKCTALIDAVIPENITEIGSEAFMHTGIYTAEIPDTVTKIGASAFNSCPNLLSVKLPAKLEALSNGMFGNCSKLQSIKMPAATESNTLGNGFVQGCSALTSLTLPPTITKIEGGFSGSGIREIDLSHIQEYGSAIASSKIENVILNEGITKLIDLNQAHELRYLRLPSTFIRPTKGDSISIGLNRGGGGQQKLAVIDARAVEGFDKEDAKKMAPDNPYTSPLPTETDSYVFLLGTSADAALSKEEVSFIVGATDTVTHNIPEGKTIVWGSANPDVATVENGLITGVGIGTTYVYVKTTDDAYCDVVKVTVTNESSDASIAKLNISGFDLLNPFEQGASTFAAYAQKGSKMLVSVTPSDSRATVTINGEDGSTAVDVSGKDLITIVVTPFSGETDAKTYKLGVTYTNDRQPDDSQILPAPGQFMGDPVWGFSSLGGHGGFVINQFDEPIKNDPTNLYGIDFIVNGNVGGVWSEPGSVKVAQDKDKDGEPDKWYNLAGAWHYNDELIWGYQVTYENPTPGEYTEPKDVPWTDNQGGSGVVKANSYHDGNSYYPNPAVFPLAQPDKTTYPDGVLFTKAPAKYGADFGYFDSLDDGCIPSVPKNPYVKDTSAGGGMDISWAVDENGLPVYLDEVSFVMAYSSVFGDTGATGDLSSEYTGMSIASNNPAVGKTPEATKISVVADGQTIEIPVEAGKYIYNLKIDSDTAKVKVETTAENIYVNDKKTEPNTNSEDVSTKKKVIRIITQNGIDAPVIYYLNLGEAVPEEKSYEEALADVLTYIKNTTPSPTVSSVGGEWAVLGLARAGAMDAATRDAYLANLEAYIHSDSTYSYDEETGKVTFTQRQRTDNERVVLALTSLGLNAADWKGYDFVSALTDKQDNGDYQVAWQGVNGTTFALLALDSNDYLTNIPELRGWLLTELLSQRTEEGIWDEFGAADTTAMALQALAPYVVMSQAEYDALQLTGAPTYAQIKEAVDTALVWISENQSETGDIGGTSESVSQTIVALSSLGIDPDTDTRFVKASGSLIDALLAYRKADGSFSHKLSDSTGSGGMSTEQAAYALVAYDRFVKNQNTLYDMSDAVEIPDDGVDRASLNTLIAKVEALNENKYTTASWETLQTALTAAKEASANEDVTQGEIDEARKALQAAVDALVTIGGGSGSSSSKIKASFRLIGAKKVSSDIDLSNGDYNGADYETWIATKSYTMNEGDTVYDLFVKAIDDAGITAKGQEKNYVETITAPEALGGYELSEFTNGKYSGWMYTINGEHPGYGLKEQVIKDGDKVIWHYVNDYRYEVEDWFDDDPNYPALGDGTYWNKWLEAEDSNPAGDDNDNDNSRPNTGGGSRPSTSGGGTPSIVVPSDPNPGTDAEIPFTDISSHWAKDSIAYAYENGLMTGVSETEFSPDSVLSRAMLVTVLYRMAGEPETAAGNMFSDVPADTWYTNAVLWASENGIVSGYGDGIFAPDDAITREQLAAIFYRYAGLPEVSGTELDGFTDADAISEYAQNAMLWAVQNGIVNGKGDGVIDPAGNATRAETAAIFYRYLEKAE